MGKIICGKDIQNALVNSVSSDIPTYQRNTIINNLKSKTRSFIINYIGGDDYTTSTISSTLERCLWVSNYYPDKIDFHEFLGEYIIPSGNGWSYVWEHDSDLNNPFNALTHQSDTGRLIDEDDFNGSYLENMFSITYIPSLESDDKYFHDETEYSPLNDCYLPFDIQLTTNLNYGTEDSVLYSGSLYSPHYGGEGSVYGSEGKIIVIPLSDVNNLQDYYFNITVSVTVPFEYLGQPYYLYNAIIDLGGDLQATLNEPVSFTSGGGVLKWTLDNVTIESLSNINDIYLSGTWEPMGEPGGSYDESMTFDLRELTYETWGCADGHFAPIPILHDDISIIRSIDSTAKYFTMNDSLDIITNATLWYDVSIDDQRSGTSSQQTIRVSYNLNSVGDYGYLRLRMELQDTSNTYHWMYVYVPIYMDSDGLMSLGPGSCIFDLCLDLSNNSYGPNIYCDMDSCDGTTILTPFLGGGSLTRCGSDQSEPFMPRSRDIKEKGGTYPNIPSNLIFEPYYYNGDTGFYNLSLAYRGLNTSKYSVVNILEEDVYSNRDFSIIPDYYNNRRITFKQVVDFLYGIAMRNGDIVLIATEPN